MSKPNPRKAEHVTPPLALLQRQALPPRQALLQKNRPLGKRWMKNATFAVALTSVALLSACEGMLGAGSLGDSDANGSGDGNGDGDGGIKYDENGNRIFPTPEFNLDGEPYYARAVPLTNDQWANAVRDILNLPAEPTQANSFLAPVGGFTLFPNNERVLEVTNQMREAYQLAAAELAVELLGQPDGVSRINAGLDADTFVRSFGRRAFRRPLSEEEVAAYVNLYNIGAGVEGDQPAFDKGANLVVEGMLQSPHFLYRTELAPDGGPLTGYEVITKLSFWLLGTSPSDALLDRAAAGEFDTPAGISAVVDQMLLDPAAADMAVSVYAELFKFSRYRDVIKSAPEFRAEVNDELDAVSRMFFRHIYDQNLGLEEILTSTQGFVGPELAQYYGISPAPAVPTLTELGPDRSGYFSQVPYLMLLGDDGHSDAIHRGVALNYQVMCAKLPVPPGEIPPLSPPDPNQTDRQRIEDHTGFGTCGENCHGGYINPLGFAFENFDGLGRVRTVDNGFPVDTASSYPVGDEGMVPFDGAPELMSILANSTEAHTCFAKSLLSYGLQRDVVVDDQALLDQLTAVSMSDVGSIKEILRAIVKSDAFLARPGAL